MSTIVLIPGVDRSNGIVRFDCTICNCVFAADKDDYNTYKSYFGKTNYFSTCPCCKNVVYKQEDFNYAL